MLSARHIVIMRWAKSRHTPLWSFRVSSAEVMELLVFDWNVTWLCTQSLIASTRP
ncbi:hypothetical protein Y695_04546 [Hydrogenophaga sp. T4]|nr:hypothetical protein Y695_04546 [Hydrogenophaga sp. T4]